MKGTTNAQRNAVVGSSSAVDKLTLTMADGTTQQHTVSDMIPKDTEPTSGSAKFVTSGAIKTALDKKVSTEAGKGLSTNDYTTTEKNKVSNLPANANTTFATKDELTAAVSSVYKFKGSVATYSNLPTSGQTAGDVYNVEAAYGNVPAGTNWAWNGSAWDALAGTVDLSPYAKSTDVANTYATQSALTSGLAGKQNTLTFDSTPTSGSSNPVTSGGVYSAINNINTSVEAGAGITVSGNTVSLATSGVTAGSKGSATAVPVITVDSYGRVTKLSTSTIYPPTSAGTRGQYWESDGRGAGTWTTPTTSASSGSSTLITSGGVYSALSSKMDKKTIDTTVTSGSSNLITSGAVYTAIDNKITISTSDPSGGSDGDIWIKYS